MTHPANTEAVFAGRHAELWLGDNAVPLVYVNAPSDREAFTADEARELMIELASVLAHVERLGKAS